MNEASARGTLTLTSAEVCDRGKVREENQDNVRSARIPLGELLIVADGIGGYQGGATASRMVVEGFLGQLAVRTADTPPERALQEACAYTNASIFKTAGSTDPTLHRMGSTVVLALIQLGASASSPPIAWVGHVGDSRAYLIRGGKLQKITNDHSAVQSLISRNLITEEEARNHPDASVLTRSLGHRPEVEIEIDRVPLQPGDAMLLCSDGLWGYVSDTDIAAVATDQSLSVDTIADALLHQALAAGGQDNIGIEFLRIGGAAITASVVPPAMPLKAGLSNAVASKASSSKAGAAGQPVQAASPYRKQQILAIALLLLGGCGYLGYFAMSHDWFNFHKKLNQSPSNGDNPVVVQQDKSHPPPQQQPIHGHAPTPTPNPELPAPKPTVPQHQVMQKRIAVVGDLQAGQREIQAAEQNKQWSRVPVTQEKSAACIGHAKSKAAIYVDPSVDMKEAIDVAVSYNLGTKDVDQHIMNDQIRKDCGSFEAVVFLPTKRPIAPTDQTPATLPPSAEQDPHPQQDPQATTNPPAHPGQPRAHPQEPR